MSKKDQLKIPKSTEKARRVSDRKKGLFNPTKLFECWLIPVDEARKKYHIEFKLTKNFGFKLSKEERNILSRVFYLQDERDLQNEYTTYTTTIENAEKALSSEERKRSLNII